MNGEHFQSSLSYNRSGRLQPRAEKGPHQAKRRSPLAESATKGVAGKEDLRAARAGADEVKIVSAGVLLRAKLFPNDQVGERSCIPPQRHNQGFVALGGSTRDSQVRSGAFSPHIGDEERGDLADTQSAASGEAKEDQVDVTLLDRSACHFRSRTRTNFEQFAAIAVC